jgi:hypothetical protein
MSKTIAAEARAQRGARREPKRKRAREESRQPSQRQTAQPPPSGRNASERPQPAPRGPTASDFNSMRPAKPANTKQALHLQSGAALNRAIGLAMIEEGDPLNGRFQVAQADTMDARVADYMDIGSHVTGPVRPGNGGEVIVATQEAMGSIPGVIDTVRENQDMLTASASRDRLELTGNALTLAVDAADSIQPRNSLEKMLAHQLAASHRLGMLFADNAATLIERQTHSGSVVQSVEAGRQANAAARMFASFQEGLLALDRIRRGGKQTVKVVHQHVAVASGGQAVVAAGGVRGGGRKGGGRSRNGR